ncbi:MAG TPA: hypothetical protein PKV72_01400 [Candidatus Peribacteria bacterium]|nr:hypothetical protein [Candidatus Peribacteria bacterium]
MAIEVLEADLQATPGEGTIARALNNFHGRIRGGYKRRLLNTAMADKPMREVMSGGADDAQKHSELRLNQTLRQFYETIDTLLEGLGITGERAEQLAKVAGSGARKLAPEEQAALTEYERVGVEVYRALKLMGYTDSDIVG